MNAYLQVVDPDQPYQLLEATLLTREEIAEQAADTYERMIRTCVAGKQFERKMDLTESRKEIPKARAKTRFKPVAFSIAGVVRTGTALPGRLFKHSRSRWKP